MLLSDKPGCWDASFSAYMLPIVVFEASMDSREDLCSRARLIECSTPNSECPAGRRKPSSVEGIQSLYYGISSNLRNTRYLLH